MIFAGIDAGSRAIKILIWNDDNKEVIARTVIDQNLDQKILSINTFSDLLAKNGLERGEIKNIVATGFAKKYVDFADRFVNEITCHACGVHYLIPEARTVIEIGGQDSKFLSLDSNGIVVDFMMNDRCAAGTGRFFEVLSARLNIGLDELGRLAEKSRHPSNISSMCVIFAETEINGLLASGVKREDIVAGVQMSIANRISAMTGRSVKTPVVFTGGVALIPYMDIALSKTLGYDVSVVPEPQFTGALGAAIITSHSISENK